MMNHSFRRSFDSSVWPWGCQVRWQRAPCRPWERSYTSHRDLWLACLIGPQLGGKPGTSLKMSTSRGEILYRIEYFFRVCTVPCVRDDMSMQFQFWNFVDFYVNILQRNSKYSSVLKLVKYGDCVGLPFFVELWTKNCFLLSPPTTVNFPMSSVEGMMSVNYWFL